MGRSVPGILLILLVCVPIAGGATAADPDARGDVRRTLEEPVDDPRVDILNVTGSTQGMDVHLSIELARDEHTTLAFNESMTYVFVARFRDTPTSLYQDKDVTVTCQRNWTQDGIRCTPQPDLVIVRSVRSVGPFVNITLRLTEGPAPDHLAVGAGTNLLHGTGNETELQAFDLSPLADPFGGGQTGGHDHGDRPSSSEAPRPWWRTPWVFLVAAVVGILIGYAWNRRKQA